jgi:hypothetical protein
MNADTWHYLLVIGDHSSRSDGLFEAAMTNDKAKMPNEVQSPKQCQMTKPKIQMRRRGRFDIQAFGF